MESISSIFTSIFQAFMQFSVRDVVDIAIVAVCIYKLLQATRETRAVQVFKGIGIILIAAILADYFKLSSVSWLLSTILQSGILFVIVLFQPELRKALEGIGRGSVFNHISTLDEHSVQHMVSQLREAMLEMSRRKVGALIVIRRRAVLTEIVKTGTIINSDISSPLLMNIFEPNTPLHDGAVVIQEDKILAAGCLLPLSDNTTISKELGTRHRAALGISEQTDSITFIVSEETGVISYTKAGKLIRYLDKKTITDVLEEIYGTDEEKAKTFSALIRRKKQ